VITAEKVRIIQITILGSLEGLGFRACHRASAQCPTATFSKANVLGKLQESDSMRWWTNHVAVNLLSWVCLNISFVSSKGVRKGGGVGG